MPDLHFDQFASPKNLKQSFKYVKLEIKSSTLPLDPFWVPGIKAIEVLGDAFFTSLSKLLIDGQYQPDDVYFFHQHKENFGIRRLAMITVVDRVVYQALLNPRILGNQLSKHVSLLCTSPGIANDGDDYLENYKKPYQAYWDTQKEYFDQKRMDHRGEYDIHSFYDNISHEVLFDMLERDDIGTTKTRLILKTILSNWHKHSRGIPQGPAASSVIANYYLAPIDIFFEKSSDTICYVRYMDDFSIFTKTEQRLFESVENLTELLDKLCLNLNSKTRMEVVKNSDYFNNKGLFSSYQQSDLQEEDSTFFDKARNDVPKIIRNISLGQDVSRSELSELKYFLRSSKDYWFAEKILQLYPKLPSFADVIVRYLQPIGSESRVQIWILKLLSEQHLFRWQQLWIVKLILIEKIKQTPRFFEIDFRKRADVKQRGC